MRGEPHVGLRPPASAWVAAIHATPRDTDPLSAGFVVDADRVLTSARAVHARHERGDELWVAFPKAGDLVRRRIRVRRVALPADRTINDVAVLTLADPVPAELAARLRCPAPGDLVGSAWWSFGFPGGDWRGGSASGSVGEDLSYGLVRLDTEGRTPVEPGYGGAALWSPAYGAVVGMVSPTDGATSCAVTLWQIDRCLPDQKLRALATWSVEAAGEEALAAWGWSLDTDPEADRHWRPRARGVSVESERGFRFRGRRTALVEIVAWLGDVQDRRALVVTGSPGVGKSAVLGRIVTTADAGITACLPADDSAVRASVGSVACAVHAKGKTALDVAVEIARAASATLPRTAEDLPAALRLALTERAAETFTVVIDALDEATTPEQSRTIVTRIVLPLIETCGDIGVRILLGSRRADDAGDLLSVFGPGAQVLNLDAPRYFSEADLEAYAVATLQLLGDERPDNPYTERSVALPVARRISALADRNFLVAGLVARTHGLYDRRAVTSDAVAFTPTVDAALGEYLRRLPALGSVRARPAFTALAFAEAPGFTLGLWQRSIAALTGLTPALGDLRAFAKSSAANFLIENSQNDDATSYRLFHQALNDALLRIRSDEGLLASDERALARAMRAAGRAVGWDRADAYLLRSLPAHAARGGVLDDLLRDELFLLHADLGRLTPLADRHASAALRSQARLIRKTPAAIDACPDHRVALFSVTESMEQLGSVYGSLAHPAPYRAAWSSYQPNEDEATLDGHTGSVNAVCSVEVQGKELLASGGADGTVRLWNPETGQSIHVLRGHRGWVQSLCALCSDSGNLLASSGGDGVIRVWNPATREVVHSLTGHTSWIRALTRVRTADGDRLVSAGSDGTVRVWDPHGGAQLRRWTGAEETSALCSVPGDDGHDLVAGVGYDGHIHLWDPTGASPPYVSPASYGWLTSVCATLVDGRPLVAAGSENGALWLLGPSPRETRGWLFRGALLHSVVPVDVGGRTLVATAGSEATVHLIDPLTHETVQPARGQTGHSGWIEDMCTVRVGDRTMLATAGKDGSIRLWDPARPRLRRPARASVPGPRTVCTVREPGTGELFAFTAGGDISFMEPATGAVVRTVPAATSGMRGGILRICTPEGPDAVAQVGRFWYQGAVRIVEPSGTHELPGPVPFSSACDTSWQGRPQLALGTADGQLWLYDGGARRVTARSQAHLGSIRALCTVRAPASPRPQIASVGDDATLRLWDPVNAKPLRVLEGHEFAVRAVCAVPSGATDLIATGGSDGLIRLWDPYAGNGGTAHVLEGHSGWVRALAPVSLANRTLLLSAGGDRTVRLWNLEDHTSLEVIPVHRPATSLAVSTHGLHVCVGLDGGLLTLRLDPYLFRPRTGPTGR
ncbi:WD40 repeat domain-containing protein [Streptomyces sp. MMS24-I29]|uniref:WD40 repeat domain-containing protein n=1 Tax=Streptomyces sp. MMS24-I29 TaxID=3351480 RepID=UPI003C7CEA72